MSTRLPLLRSHTHCHTRARAHTHTYARSYEPFRPVDVLDCNFQRIAFFAHSPEYSWSTIVTAYNYDIIDRVRRKTQQHSININTRHINTNRTQHKKTEPKTTKHIRMQRNTKG